MAETHGNHKQREDEFFSCQVIQNSLLNCTVTAIAVNSASAHLGPKSTEGVLLINTAIPHFTFPCSASFNKNLSAWRWAAWFSPWRTHNTGQFWLLNNFISSFSTQPGTGETLWKSVHVPLLICGYFIHFCAAAADCKPYSGSRVCFLLQPFQMTNSCSQPLPISYKPEANFGPSQPFYLSLIHLRHDKGSKNTFSGEYEIRAVALLAKKKIKKSNIISQTIFRARIFKSGQIYTHNTTHCWEGEYDQRETLQDKPTQSCFPALQALTLSSWLVEKTTRCSEVRKDQESGEKVNSAITDQWERQRENMFLI